MVCEKEMKFAASVVSDHSLHSAICHMPTYLHTRARVLMYMYLCIYLDMRA